jgi:hypothetical protein
MTGILSQIDHCNGGDAAACAFLAKTYANGQTVPRDEESAILFASRACDIGPPQLCVEVAYKLRKTPEMREAALHLLEPICRKTAHDKSCWWAAREYLAGKIVDRSRRRAAELTRRSCEEMEGSGESCTVLLYTLIGMGGGHAPWSLESHVSILKTLCASKHDIACLELSHLYENGVNWGSDSIPKDMGKAKKFAARAETPRVTGFREGDYEIGVYSNPLGAEIILNGKSTGIETPGTVAVDAGAHTVSVRFDHGRASQERVIQAAENGEISLFFHLDGEH